MNIEYVKVGKTRKPHGVDGSLRLHVEDKLLDDVLQSDVLFLLLQGRQVPFFPDEILSESPLVIKFDEVDNREEAMKLANKEIYLRKSDIQDESVLEGPGFRQLEGFTVEDVQTGVVGVIEQMVELPEQLMAIIDREGTEVLIPINDQFVKEIKSEDKRIIMDLPEGLLDLY